MARQIFLIFSLILMSSAPTSAALLKVGDAFPSAVLLKAQAMNRKITLVDFWASWCKPCEKSLPIFSQWHEAYKGKGFSVVGVNVDSKKALGRDFVKSHKLRFPIVYDHKHSLIKKAGVSVMPTSFLIDNKGIILSIHQGFREGEEEKLLKQIKALLGIKEDS